LIADEQPHIPLPLLYPSAVSRNRIALSPLPYLPTFSHRDLIVTEPQHNIEAVTEMDTRYINKRGRVWHILPGKNLCGERKFLPVKR